MNHEDLKVVSWRNLKKMKSFKKLEKEISENYKQIIEGSYKLMYGKTLIKRRTVQSLFA